MKDWEEIINTAIIGTAKKQVNALHLSESLKPTIESIEKQNTDKEHQFLNICSIISGYRKAGFMPVNVAVEPIPECPAEEFQYASPAAIAALQAVLDDENAALLFYWLNICAEKKQVVRPEYIPVLLNTAGRNKDLRNLIIDCVGRRGKWLAQFNQNWKFENTIPSFQELWDHGKLEDRKEALVSWRNHSPEEARMALEKTWGQEQATTKADLLSILNNNLSLKDENFIKECLKEKSQKIKEAAMKLLKQLPGSFVVEEIWEFLKQHISYKKSSSMFGLLQKDSIEIDLSFQLPETFKTYGISHIDANKLYSEKEFSLSQLISVIPPSYWEEFFTHSPKEILALFDKKEETRKYLSSLASASNTYKSVKWAKLLYANHKMLCLDVVTQMDEEMQQQILMENLQNVKSIYQLLCDKKKEWNLSFTLSLLKKMAQEPHTYTKSFYKNMVHHFPVDLMERLDNVDVNDPMKQSYWMNIKEEIKRMLSIKLQIKQSF